MPVRPGIDVLIEQRSDLVAGRRIGLVGHAGSVTRALTPSADALRGLEGTTLAALFAPEHGYHAVVADARPVAPDVDARTGLPIHSLYGATDRPTGEMLDGLDALVFDLQDVGVRFYTYTATLLRVMEAAADHGLPVIVCDRPNPIGGERVEGPMLEPGFESFLGPGPLPLRHGMTAGELAVLYNEAWGVGCDLTVVPCLGWERGMWHDETGLLWVPPSPGMPKLDTATVYPGTCLIEGTNLSEGRGTATPFETVGAPWVDGRRLAEALEARRLPGVRVRACRFEPCSDDHAGVVCRGVQLHVVDRHAFRPVTAGLHLIAAVRALHPDAFAWRPERFDLLAGTDAIRKQLDRGVPVEEIAASWEAGREDFEAQRRAVLLY